MIRVLIFLVLLCKALRIHTPQGANAVSMQVNPSLVPRMPHMRFMKRIWEYGKIRIGANKEEP